jgi:hypothetical protein
MPLKNKEKVIMEYTGNQNTNPSSHQQENG